MPGATDDEGAAGVPLGGRSRDRETAVPRERDFVGLYERWWPVARAAAQTVLDDENEAADAAQDVFVRLWENVRSPAIRKPDSYFWRAGYNAALKRHAQHERHVPLKDVQRGRDVRRARELDGFWVRQRREALQQLLDEELPPRCAAVMTLVYVVGLSRREAAAKLDTTIDAVEKQITRGRKLLRDKRDTPLVRAWVSYFEDGGG